jgi:hypothetical protein
MKEYYVGAGIVPIGGKTVGAKIVKVRGRKIPKNILPSVITAISDMLKMHVSEPTNAGKIVGRTEYYDQVVIVETRFRYNRKGDGLMFHIFLFLRNVVRCVSGYPVKTIPFETIRATLAVKPFVDRLAFN